MARNGFLFINHNFQKKYRCVNKTTKEKQIFLSSTAAQPFIMPSVTTGQPSWYHSDRSFRHQTVSLRI
ncbi:hypothetical protein HMPREF1250_0864 [Megasphaera vaginalis (ex Srinivasan et al. 2021)]|uniref:Uncharacterized protein n=1 Tax=Megasphaera vaginalis (ex Srinivasan et al. 2021) TaxID=1111454 RepID=U7UM94_9FIRM|nr:hypothetical protein HMPREF1250_0864 [Megasphaera vaginalis (ex Srinivasan et al. 2021)]